jgi:Zn finger protein HypA/HybF involved in hydrogenase expression
MGLFNTLTAAFKASTQSPNRGDATGDESAGAYWCHDCQERIRDVDHAGEGSPDCPSCGDQMTFERSVGSTGCAC